MEKLGISITDWDSSCHALEVVIDCIWVCGMLEFLGFFVTHLCTYLQRAWLMSYSLIGDCDVNVCSTC